MSTAKTQSKPRPYWHVDAKWIFGILLLFALVATLLLFNLGKLTERDSAVKISATAVASLFGREGLDSDEGLEEFRQQAAATPGDEITPIEQFPGITISKEDALTLEPRELRITIFSQLTGSIYDNGLEGAAAEFTDDPEEQEDFAQEASLLGIFTETTHQTLQKLFWPAVIATVLLLAAVVYFSAGWGRLVSPGIILFIVSLPGAVLSAILLQSMGDGSSAGGLPQEVTETVGNSLSQSYAITTAIGAGLLVAALIGKITQRIMRSRNTSFRR